MSKAWLKSLVLLLAGAGLASAQTPSPTAPMPGYAVAEQGKTEELGKPKPGEGPPVEDSPGAMPAPAGPSMVPVPATIGPAYNNAFFTATPPPTDNAFDPYASCRRPCCSWVSAEYLFWWVKSTPNVPLTTGGFSTS